VCVWCGGGGGGSGQLGGGGGHGPVLLVQCSATRCTKGGVGSMLHSKDIDTHQQ
jgi:hypothetical protein